MCTGNVEGSNDSDLDGPGEHIAKRNFLRYVFHKILGSDRKKCPSYWAKSYLAEELLSKLPAVASAEDLVALCDTPASIESSYSKSLSALGKEWQRISPDVKAEIRHYVENSVFSRDFWIVCHH